MRDGSCENNANMILYALTIFVSAFLLFLVQPIIAKQILPWFGGSAAVWSTCLVFFQVALLAGYFYSDWTTRRLSARQQALLHVALILVALCLLPIIPPGAWKPMGDEEPSVRILLLLATTIGLPYFLLATTSPLVQVWFARAYPDASPYRLFALSNLASMLALVGYPFGVEPYVTTRHQAVAWSIGFGFFAVLIACAAWKGVLGKQVSSPGQTALTDDAPPSLMDKVVWVALAALGSVLLLGVSNHLTQNISSIPLLWVLPLALYLITFILCFDGAGWYRRMWMLPITGIAIVAMAWLLADRDYHFRLLLQIGVFSAGLFIACMYCHGELAARKPAARYLTTFYLMVSVGGAIGSLLVGIVAPMTLPAYYELSFGLCALALLATFLMWTQFHWSWRLPAVGVSLFALSAAIYTVVQFGEDVIVMTRNFYGTLRVKEYGPPDSQYRRRSLVHGAILHGEQYMDPPYNRSATSYYKSESGIGVALLLKEKMLSRPRRVGIIGLGAGTIAAYGDPGDVFRFYDINPAVVTIAKRDFTYVKDSAATIEIALGDARLSMERETPQRFDVLAIDAFSSDSIPVHLITLEALEVYERHMQPDGIIAFHVSNRFLDLKPVVERIATERGWRAAWIRDSYDDGSTSSDWVLLCRDKKVLLRPEIASITQPIAPEPGWRTWTDDFSNLRQVLKRND
jgi:SAM-dependent methyltransferase